MASGNRGKRKANKEQGNQRIIRDYSTEKEIMSEKDKGKNNLIVSKVKIKIYERKKMSLRQKKSECEGKEM